EEWTGRDRDERNGDEGEYHLRVTVHGHGPPRSDGTPVAPPERYLKAGITCWVGIEKPRFARSAGMSPPESSSATMPFRPSSSCSPFRRSMRPLAEPTATRWSRICSSERGASGWT